MSNEAKLLTPEPNIFEVRAFDGQEVLRITPDGRIFWKQREVETDDDFRAAMLALSDALVKIHRGWLGGIHDL